MTRRLWYAWIMHSGTVLIPMYPVREQESGLPSRFTTTAFAYPYGDL
jgi:hypothetical protein